MANRCQYLHIDIVMQDLILKQIKAFFLSYLNRAIQSPQKVTNLKWIGETLMNTIIVSIQHSPSVQKIDFLFQKNYNISDCFAEIVVTVCHLKTSIVIQGILKNGRRIDCQQWFKNISPELIAFAPDYLYSQRSIAHEKLSTALVNDTELWKLFPQHIFTKKSILRPWIRSILKEQDTFSHLWDTGASMITAIRVHKHINKVESILETFDRMHSLLQLGWTCTSVSVHGDSKLQETIMDELGLK